MLTKSESLQLKGAAILIMVFLHLFMTPSNVDLCQTYLYFRGEPVVSQLSKFTGICVGLYLFLSGYGLYITYQRNPNIQPWKRIVKFISEFLDRVRDFYFFRSMALSESLSWKLYSFSE